MAFKLVFTGGALKAPPPATRDAFQMLPQVGLTSQIKREYSLERSGLSKLNIKDNRFFPF